jgi:Fe2+ transport system protein FeoA
MKPLKDLKKGETGKIVAMVSYRDTLLTRMSAMGIRIGQPIEVLQKGWLRPIHIRIGMTEMFIRKKDAQNIWID